MKLSRRSAVSLFFVVIGIAGLGFGTSLRVAASADEQIPSALTFSQAWVGQIDAGKYDESYEQTCEAMRKKVGQDRWSTILKGIRAMWGSVVSRQQVSHVYKPNGYDGLEGECIVITYDTTFKKLDNAMEVIVLKWEDGRWLGAGYNAGPKPKPDDGTSTTMPDPTEIHTDEHATPQNAH